MAHFTKKKLHKTGETFKVQKTEFINNLDNFFDIAYSNALELIKVDVDNEFLINQRLPDQIGCLGGADRKLQ